MHKQRTRIRAVRQKPMTVTQLNMLVLASKGPTQQETAACKTRTV
ncbi:hypothetical protein D4764_09G0010150 [Takifugu flavidus]|uniref:Uncharacterized protein n=1 Tax=Takifugu flavidus TaxID=433684 RepID=A0A5C6MMP4_9TELE|nr:hypothetical protein D4764_09G0010150 [Takifugu flavidus]